MTFLMGCLLALAAMLPSQGAIGTPLIAGQANFADESHGSGYLAMRLDRGTHVRITGAGGTALMTVNDYGPKNPAKVADIALVVFTRVCGFASRDAARRAGICPVEIEILGDGPTPTLPATDTLEEALPEGWAIAMLWGTVTEDRWAADACPFPAKPGDPHKFAGGPTPAAALHALAEALRDAV